MKKVKMILLLVSMVSVSCRKEINERLSTGIKTSAVRTSSQKNVVLILGDDVGYENLGCNGGQSYLTPNLDALATGGMRFTQCHSSPLCSPSRTALLTGKYNKKNYTGWGQLGLDQKTIANMLESAGYATCIAGKWQYGGGDTAIHIFGFQKYAVFDPYTTYASDEDTQYRRYINPTVFSDGVGLWDTSLTNRKYGPDIFLNYSLKFIDSSVTANTPFFLHFSSALAHKPFTPTPDDPEYISWLKNPNKPSNKKFYASMNKYMDKQIGKIMAHLDSLGILNNTIVIFIGDNGDPTDITSVWKDAQGSPISITGGKGTTTEKGTHVPMIVKRIGTGIDTGLVDFPDFMVSIADMVGLARPTTYGTLDGFSFVDSTVNRRTYSYDYYNPKGNGTQLAVWAQTYNRRVNDGNAKVYIVQWPFAETFIPNNQLTPQDKATRTFLGGIISTEGAEQ